MQNVIWAYKYYVLADSNVVLNSQKSVEDYEQDLDTIQGEIQTANERYASDFQRKLSPYHMLCDLPLEKAS